MKRITIIKLCWLVPLFIGLSIFISWLIVRNNFLAILGIFTIYLGILAFVIGIFLCIFELTKIRNDTAHNRRIISYALLLVINIPIALLLAYSAFLIETAYTITIINKSNYSIKDCVVKGGGVSKNIGSIPSGNKESITFWVKEDGSLSLIYKISNDEKKIPFNEYVTHSTGGKRVIEVK